MKKPNEIFDANRNNYENLYLQEEAFLRYPADWLIRFHNMFLKNKFNKNAKILDYGCGSGNNSIFFLNQGYDVFGVDVAPSFKKLVSKNLDMNSLSPSLVEKFSIIEADTVYLDYPDNHFDFVFSNQVLYYLPTKEHLRKVSLEIKRILKPSGFVFFTMMGPQNYYITHHLKQIHNERVYEIRIEDEKHRLYGVEEHILIVKDEKDLCDLFGTFETVTTGYFDQKMFDLYSNFHYIYVGSNNK